MRVSCYVGSRSNNTISFYLAKGISKQLNPKIKLEIFHGRNTLIKECKGCDSCFKYGECLQDSQDDMGDIRKKMLETDMIIWISPVYL